MVWVCSRGGVGLPRPIPSPSPRVSFQTPFVYPPSQTGFGVLFGPKWPQNFDYFEPNQRTPWRRRESFPGPSFKVYALSLPIPKSPYPLSGVDFWPFWEAEKGHFWPKFFFENFCTATPVQDGGLKIAPIDRTTSKTVYPLGISKKSALQTTSRSIFGRFFDFGPFSGTLKKFQKIRKNFKKFFFAKIDDLEVLTYGEHDLSEKNFEKNFP